MRCVYCDTAYAFSGGKSMALSEIMTQVTSYLPLPLAMHYVTVTGGEPLAQKECLSLLTLLCDAGYSVSLETGGAMDTSEVDERVSVVLDIKTPGSGEVEKNLWSNLQHLKPTDEVKFVLCDRKDYEWARQVLAEHSISSQCGVLFSPVHDQINPTALAEWILQDKLAVRMQVQLHKILWGEVAGK
jgi:7-carboxy-7-deazaguanine synthase